MNQSLLKKPIKLDCQVQHNSWGKYPKDSLVAQLKNIVNDDRPYAELWLGAHPNFPAKIRQTEISTEAESLDKLISKYPKEILGETVIREFGPELPFLFKILSIRTALSIQAHPNRQLAQLLHGKDPQNYPDSNHKLEIAIALTPVSLLCGFRPLEEIKEFILTTPELSKLISENILQEINSTEKIKETQAIGKIYRVIMTSDTKKISELSQALFARLSTKDQLNPEELWLLRLQTEYPQGDVGLFCFFLLKLRFLNPGQAIFISSGTPHAYLEGNLAECMTNSDNVVRAGLTPKHKDIPTLIEMANIEPQNNYQLIAIEDSANNHLTRFQPPLNEYCVDQLKGDFAIECATQNKVEVIFCLLGSGSLSTGGFVEEVKPGDAFILPALIDNYSLEINNGQVFRVTVPV